MVQLMNSGKRVAVKLEVEDALEDELSPPHKKGSKLDPSLQEGDNESRNFLIPPSLYNPLDEPSPLGLRLKKSPSFLDLIQMKLSQQNADKLAALKKKDSKGVAVSGVQDKLKASNFPASLLRIGSWEYKSRYEGDLVAKCYFAKHKLVWEVLDGGLKNKIEIQWSDIVAIKANYTDDGPETFDVVLARQPLFFRETNPQPRKHTLWQASSDFTGGQASIHRQHFLQCQQGLLGKHFEKLIQCDPRLNFLSKQPEILLESPYFEPRISGFNDSNEAGHGVELKSEEGHIIFGLQDPLSPSAGQSSSCKNEQDFSGRATENFCQGTPSPSSVMDTHAIEEIRGSTAKEGKLLGQWDQIRFPGIHASMSMSDLVNHIGNCICGQMTSSLDDLQSRDILEEITQYLLNDSQLTPASDEECLMSRVNSLCCLLQKDSAVEPNFQPKEDDAVDVHDYGKIVEGSSVSAPARESKTSEGFPVTMDESNDVSGSKRPQALSRKDSVGDLLLNLPRIASLPQFLFNIMEDSDREGR
ncbi:uncharacterized protein LOC111274370 [Durio zibethinus]|uniref:Uncharacterized protein LOC111274370 n=1 Tax=Durio zibethinus TaxID=66656 RepID=A0A6P5WF79_DURZI|nr:uncharacterized protein LOC111274370 [Durio zibethinus]